MWSTLNGVAGSLTSAAKAGTGLAKGILDAASDEFRDDGQLQLKEKASPRADKRCSKVSSRRKDVHSSAHERIGNGIDSDVSPAFSDAGAARRGSAPRLNGADSHHSETSSTGKRSQAPNGHHGGWLSSASSYLEKINHVVVGTPGDEELSKLRTQLQLLKAELLEVNVARDEENHCIVATYEQRIHELSAENSRLLSQLGSGAATQQQYTRSDEMRRLHSKLKRTESALEERNRELGQLKAQLQNLSESTTQHSNDPGELQQQLAAAEAQSAAARRQLEVVNTELEAAKQQHAKSQQELLQVRSEAREMQQRSAKTEAELQRLQQLLAEHEEQVDELMEQLSSGQVSDSSSVAACLKHEREQHQQSRAELELAQRQLAHTREEAESVNQALSARDAFWIKELDAERAAGAEKLAQAQAELQRAQEAAAAAGSLGSSAKHEELLQQIGKLHEERQQLGRSLESLRQQLSCEEQRSTQPQQRVDELDCFVRNSSDDELAARLQEQQAAVLEAHKQTEEVERRYQRLLSQVEEEQEQLRQWLDEETHSHTDTKISAESAQAHLQAQIKQLEQQLAELKEAGAAGSAHLATEHAEQLSAAQSRTQAAEVQAREPEGEKAATAEQLQVLEGQLVEAARLREQVDAELAQVQQQLNWQEQESLGREQQCERQAEAAQQLQLAETARDHAMEQVQQLQQKLREADAVCEQLQVRLQQLEQLLATERMTREEKDREYSRQLRESELAVESLESELECMRERLGREHSSHSSAMQERDAFWKAEVASQAGLQVQLEQQLQQLQQQVATREEALAKGQQECGALREERDRLESEMQSRSSASSRLSAEVTSLQQQLERAQAAAALHLDQEVTLDNELMELRTTCARLQAENAQMQAELEQIAQQREQMQRNSERMSLQLEALRKERDQLCTEVESVRQRCAFLEEVAGGLAPSMLSVPSGSLPEVEELQAQVERLQASESAAESEKERLKLQLQRLKQQLLVDQEEEEEKLAWRVQQEVEAASQKFKQSDSKLQHELENAEVALTQLRAQADQWKALLGAKDAEVQNLQAVLGELAYETEAHEKASQELRVAEMRIEALKSEVAEANNRAVAAAAQQREALAATQAAERSASDWRSAHAQLQSESRTLRHALEEAMKRVTVLSSDSSSLVDRRIMVKLLVTYFERGHSKEVLTLMARMLQLSPEEKLAVGLGRTTHGLLRSVATAPFALVKSSLGLASNVGAALTSPSARSSVSTADSLADQWVDFLLQQVEGQAVAGFGTETRALRQDGSRPPSLLGGSNQSSRNPFIPPDFTGGSHPSSPARSDIPASPAVGTSGTERDQYHTTHTSQLYPPMLSRAGAHHGAHSEHDSAALLSHALPPMPASNSSITSVSSHLSHSHIHHDRSHFGTHPHTSQPVWSSAMGPPPPPPNPTSSSNPTIALVGSGGLYRGSSGAPAAVHPPSGSSLPHTAHSSGVSPHDPAPHSALHTHSHLQSPARTCSTGDSTFRHPDTHTSLPEGLSPTPAPYPRYPRPGNYDSLSAVVPPPVGAFPSIPWPLRVSIPPDGAPTSIAHSHSSSPIPQVGATRSPGNLGPDFTTIDLNSSPQGPSRRREPL